MKMLGVVATPVILAKVSWEVETGRFLGLWLSLLDDIHTMTDTQIPSLTQKCDRHLSP